LLSRAQCETDQLRETFGRDGKRVVVAKLAAYVAVLAAPRTFHELVPFADPDDVVRGRDTEGTRRMLQVRGGGAGRRGRAARSRTGAGCGFVRRPCVCAWARA
jgi:hypothetical protein